MNDKQLTKASSPEEIKGYFQAVLKLSQQKDGNEFPINLDDVWPLVYARKDMAVRALKQSFYLDVDYITDSAKMRNRLTDGKLTGSAPSGYFLSLSCMEYFIARKVRPVFEVYRQVFHKVAQSPALVKPASDNYETRLAELETRHDGRLVAQWQRILEVEQENKRLEQEIRELRNAIGTERNRRTVKEAWFEQIADELKVVRRELGKLPLKKQPEPEPEPEEVEYVTVYEYAKKNGYYTDHRLMVAMGHIATEICRQKGVKKGERQIVGGPYPSKGAYPVPVLDEVFSTFAKRKEEAV